ncbi:MAG: asparaginase domain-containing protein, partial [Elusimicrobiota bacterium]
MKIKLLITGGTFDKEYNELDGTLFFRKTHLQEMLNLGRNRVPVNVQTLMMIDSLLMTDAHRRKILAACRSAREKHIVITHGTDTMPETARLLGRQLQDKTVVLTGA